MSNNEITKPETNTAVANQVDALVRLRISQFDDETIQLEALAGIKHFGFGTFLCDLQPEEIECDTFSKQVLLKAKYQHGLQGLEIWPDNRIAWGDLSHTVLMPIEYISKADGSDWVEKIAAQRCC